MLLKSDLLESASELIDMKNDDHAVILFDDGVQAALPIKKLRCTNEHYSTK